MPKIKQLQDTLNQLSNPAQANRSKSYVNSKSYGKYCYFRGIETSVLRKLAKANKDLELEDLSTLLKAKFQEDKFIALVCLVEKNKVLKNKENQELLFQFYVKHFSYINNWHLVDVSAPYILGPYFTRRNRQFLFDCLESDNFWIRRIAMLSNWWLIRKEKDLSSVFVMAKKLLYDPEDLIHKAVGWMLKEAYRIDSKQTLEFIFAYRLCMPRTMLRYSIREYPKELRKKLMEK